MASAASRYSSGHMCSAATCSPARERTTTIPESVQKKLPRLSMRPLASASAHEARMRAAILEPARLPHLRTALQPLPRLLDQAENALDLPVAVLEPVRGPDPVHDPSTVLEHLPPEAITVARRLGGMVGDSVTLDPTDVPSRVVVVD